MSGFRPICPDLISHATGALLILIVQYANGGLINPFGIEIVSWGRPFARTVFHTELVQKAVYPSGGLIELIPFRD